MGETTNVNHRRSLPNAASSPTWKLPVQDRLAINREILENLSRPFTITTNHSLGPLVRPSDAEEPVQRWFRYREGYTAELCRRVFSRSESFVIDPFCGFGSTLVAARSEGIPSAGLDVSPLAVFVSRVKTRVYKPSLIRAIKRRIDHIKQLTASSPPAEAPTLRILHKLFHPDILHSLLIFRCAIDSSRDPLVREFLLFGWISVLEQVSNVYREGNGVKYRNRQRHGNRYSIMPYDEWQSKRFPVDKFSFVRVQLLARFQLMLDDAVALSDGPAAAVEQKDASEALNLVPTKGASLALFSPPYCNCFNYIKAYKLELWMAGFIRAYPDIKTLTAAGVRSRTESLNPVNEPYPLVIEKLIKLMPPDGLWSDQLPDVVRGYFADMQRTLLALKSSLKKNGRCVIVVGTSAYGGVLIPSDLLLAGIARNLGYDVEEIVVTRHLTTSSQQKKSLDGIKDYLRESILYLRKSQ